MAGMWTTFSHLLSGEELVLGEFPLWDCSELLGESLSDLAGAGVRLGQERKDILVKNPTKADAHSHKDSMTWRSRSALMNGLGDVMKRGGRGRWTSIDTHLPTWGVLSGGDPEPRCEDH